LKGEDKKIKAQLLSLKCSTFETRDCLISILDILAEDRGQSPEVGKTQFDSKIHYNVE